MEKVPRDQPIISFHDQVLNGLLVEMRKFASMHEGSTRVSSLIQRIDALLAIRNNCDSLRMWLLSDQANTVESGLTLLEHRIKRSAGAVGDFKDEITAVITRAILRDKETLGTITGFIAWLISEYPESMIEEYGPQVRNMLSSLASVDHEKYNFNALLFRKNIESIVKAVRDGEHRQKVGASEVGKES